MTVQKIATKQTDHSLFTSPPSNPPCKFCGEPAHFYIRQRQTIGYQGKQITIRILLCSDCCIENYSPRCQECKSIRLEKDFTRDTVSCRDCGLVHIESRRWII